MSPPGRRSFSGMPRHFLPYNASAPIGDEIAFPFTPAGLLKTNASRIPPLRAQQETVVPCLAEGNLKDQGTHVKLPARTTLRRTSHPRNPRLIRSRQSLPLSRRQLPPPPLQPKGQLLKLGRVPRILRQPRVIQNQLLQLRQKRHRWRDPPILDQPPGRTPRTHELPHRVPGMPAALRTVIGLVATRNIVLELDAVLCQHSQISLIASTATNKSH
jgi:hypothetical protein